jgi:hypothetical protein
VAWLATGRSDLGSQGIQDVQLGGDGSRMAVIDPSYQNAGTRLRSSLFPGSLAAGLHLYVLSCSSLADTDSSHAFGDFFASHASIDTCWLQQCRGQIGPASVSRSSRRERPDPKINDVIPVKLTGFRTVGDLIAVLPLGIDLYKVVPFHRFVGSI